MSGSEKKKPKGSLRDLYSEQMKDMEEWKRKREERGISGVVEVHCNGTAKKKPKGSFRVLYPEDLDIIKGFSRTKASVCGKPLCLMQVFALARYRGPV